MMELLVCFCGLYFLVFALADSPEGCSKGWLYYKQMCYLYNPHAVDAIDAKEICSTYKHSALASVWTDEESEFIINSLIPPGDVDTVWIGLVSKTNRGKGWVWLDGSAADSRSSDDEPNENTCGTLNKDGTIGLRNCWENMYPFICKASLEMTYIVSNLANTSAITDHPPKVLFERLWPPKLYDFPKLVTHIANTRVSAVTHETDCAFYCVHVRECKAFSIQCIQAWKCNQYLCDMYQPMGM